MALLLEMLSDGADEAMAPAAAEADVSGMLAAAEVSVAGGLTGSCFLQDTSAARAEIVSVTSKAWGLWLIVELLERGREDRRGCANATLATSPARTPARQASCPKASE
jgi:hypothetical protein